MRFSLSMLPFVWFDAIDALHHLKEIGAQCIEIAPRDVDHRYCSEDRFREYEKTVETLGLEPVQVHLPYRGLEGVDIGNLNDHIRAYSLEIILRAIDYAHRLGVRCAALHPGSQEALEDPHVHQRIARHVIDSCRTLHEYASGKGIILCVENMLAGRDKNKAPDPHARPPEPAEKTYRFGSSAEDLLQIREAISDISFCYDTGHALVNRQDLIAEIRKLGPSIAALHLNENDAVWDQHLPPWKTDTVDWQEVIKVLKEIGYPEQGYLNLEIRRGDTFAESIAIAREGVEAGKRMERLYTETA